MERDKVFRINEKGKHDKKHQQVTTIQEQKEIKQPCKPPVKGGNNGK